MTAITIYNQKKKKTEFKSGLQIDSTSIKPIFSKRRRHNLVTLTPTIISNTKNILYHYKENDNS